MTCQTCHGRREVRIVVTYRNSYRNVWIICPDCVNKENARD